MAILELDLTKKQCVEFAVEGHEPSLLPKGKNFKLAWADEFDGGTLDKSKLNYRTYFWQQKAVQFCDQGVSLDGNSNLIIQPVLMEDGRICSAQLQTSTNTLDLPKFVPDSKSNPCGDNNFWPLGIIPEPKFQHRYGYYEIRCKLQEDTTRHWWSAFWLQSPSIGTAYNAEYCGVENDIMEYFSDGICTSGNFYDGYATGNLKRDARVHYKKPESKDGYHRFGLLWEPDKYVFYCDGVETSRTTKKISQVEQFILISTEIEGYRKGDGKKHKEGAECILDDKFIVDYVRVFDQVKD